MKNVSVLDLKRNCIGDQGLLEICQSLKYSLSIVHIDISSNELGPKGGSALFKALAVNESITSVDISSHEGLHRNRIATKGMKNIVPVLKNNKILSILNLTGNSIKSDGLQFLAEGIIGNTTLLSLKLNQNEIQGISNTLKYIKTILIESRLKELDLSDNPLGNQCIEGIANILTGASISLKRLYLANVGINCIFFA